MKTGILVALGFMAFALPFPQTIAQTAEPETTPSPGQNQEQIDMTPERLGEMILRLDEAAEQNGSAWTFSIEGMAVTLVYDTTADRMRLMVAISKTEGLTKEQMLRLLQADFDSALDARYAIAQNVLWSVFIHPLSTLTDEDFLSGIGQTVNLALTYGVTFSSGALVFGGGDSQDLLERRQLIDRLLEEGTPI